MIRNKEDYTFHAVTIPGFGGSQMPDLPLWSDEPLWQENALAALRAFIDEHDVKDAIVLSHSWGSVISAQLLAEDADFARGWINLDNFVPFNQEDQALPYAEKLKRIASWREDYMEPVRTPDEWAKFNKPASYTPPDRQLLYHGMFMATPQDVVFQYWRENGLTNTNDAFGLIDIPVLEVKSISPRETDSAQKKHDYLAQYETTPHPRQMKTIFIENSYHFIHEQRPEIIDEIVAKFAAGEALSDYAPPK